MDKMRLTASERESLLRFAVAHEILALEGTKLRRRFKGIKGGLRDLGMLRAKIGKLLEEVVDTIPDEQQDSFYKTLELSTYTVGVRKPSRERNENDYGIWISLEVLNALLDACHDRCLLCPGDKAKRRACKLRKALTIIPNDIPDRDDGDCPYYGTI